jgi:cation-transporting P-type ATPase 13A2
LALLISIYMVLMPAQWVKQTMQLTKMSWDYKLFLVALGFAYLLIAWIFEKHVSLRLAKLAGRWKEAATGQSKTRKAYKVVEDDMRA